MPFCLPACHHRRGRRKICCGRTTDPVVVESSGELAVEAAWLSRTREISVCAVKVGGVDLELWLVARQSKFGSSACLCCLRFRHCCHLFCFVCQVARSWRCGRSKKKGSRRGRGRCPGSFCGPGPTVLCPGSGVDRCSARLWINPVRYLSRVPGWGFSIHPYLSLSWSHMHSWKLH